MHIPEGRSPISALLSLAAAAAFWFAFAPAQLGGWTTYVIVDGNSMEPKFHFGDLVLVRKQGTYQAGDAVTYQNAEMNRYVFHRIVNMEGGRFVLQGDHNTWLDSYHPSQDEIVGKLWIHIPSAGKAIQWAREPLPLAVGVALLGGVMAAGLILNSPNSGRGRNVPKPAFGLGNMREAGLYLAGFAAIAFAGFAVFAFTRPLKIPSEPVHYQQEAQFTYSAAGAPGVYDTGTIEAGQPIFPKLTCFLNVGLSYAITGDNLQGVTGNHRLYMRVFDEKSGWQRNIPLTGETYFSGNSFTSRAELNLCDIEALTTSMESQTGLHPSIYTLEVIAPTVVMGVLDGQAVYDSFEPKLTFKFDSVHFRLETEDAGQSDPLRAAQAGAVKPLDALPNTLDILGVQFDVWTLRALALMGLAFSLAALAGIGWTIYQGMKASPTGMIQMKYRGLLMNVHRINIRKNLPIVDVASIDDLARLAERQNALIAHAVLNFLHCYTVQSNGAMYRYVVSDTSRPPELEQTLPRPALPRSVEPEYLDAMPIDDEHYGYNVEAEDSHMLKRIRL